MTLVFRQLASNKNYKSLFTQAKISNKFSNIRDIGGSYQTFFLVTEIGPAGQLVHHNLNFYLASFYFLFNGTFGYNGLVSNRLLNDDGKQERPTSS